MLAVNTALLKDAGVPQFLVKPLPDRCAHRGRGSGGQG
jgi:hypothetical protein